MVSDGAGGLKKAIAQCFPLVDRGRCISHKMLNLMNKLPKDKTIIDHPSEGCVLRGGSGNGSGISESIYRRVRATYPSMIKCLKDDLKACLMHLKYPWVHLRSIRTSNLIERLYVERKRRTKVIPNHVNDKGTMKLVYGTLIRKLKLQRVTMDQADLVFLKTFRQTMCKNHNLTLHDDRISFKLAA